MDFSLHVVIQDGSTKRSGIELFEFIHGTSPQAATTGLSLKVPNRKKIRMNIHHFALALREEVDGRPSPSAMLSSLVTSSLGTASKSGLLCDCGNHIPRTMETVAFISIGNGDDLIVSCSKGLRLIEELVRRLIA